jgi:hypothetical protein
MTGSAQQPRAQAAAAARFAAVQAAQLAGAVRARGDRQEADRLLAQHDAAHPRWMEAFGALRATTPAAAQRLLVLYAFCGHVAGSLEAPPRRGLGRACADVIDGVLVRCLEDLAAAVADAERRARPEASPSGVEPG